MVYHLDSFSCFFLEGLRMRVSARFPLLFYTFLNRLDFALFIPPVGVCLGCPSKSQHGAFFGGLRRSSAWLLHGGYHLAVEFFEAALGIGESVIRNDTVKDGEHFGFLELDRIGRGFVTNPLIRVGSILHEYIIAERELLSVFEQSCFDLYASDGE